MTFLNHGQGCSPYAGGIAPEEIFPMIKKALLACLLAAVTMASAQTGPVVGEVLEAQNVEGYTYLRLKTTQGQTWAAVPTASVKVGAKVAIENPMVMQNFQSKALKRTFDKVVFGTLAGSPAAAAKPATGDPHATQAKAPEAPDIKVPRAMGPNARSVAEIMVRPAQLKDQPVVVRAKIVKINSGIQGVNWVHLRDGTGSAANGTHDLIVTTKDELKVGDVVTMKGVVRTDKDLGSGYVYKVIVEEGAAQR
jgi:hypothetical protein